MKKSPKTFINVVFRHSSPYTRVAYIRVAITRKALVRISRYIPHFEGFYMPINMQYEFWMETDLHLYVQCEKNPPQKENSMNMELNQCPR